MAARMGSGPELEPPGGASAGEAGFELPAWQRAGCLRDPCSTDSDPALFFASPELRQLRETLLAALRRDAPSLSVVTGVAGVGKTMLLRELESSLLQVRAPVVLLSGDLVELPWHEPIGAGTAPTILLIDGAENCGEAVLGELKRWIAAGETSGLRAVICGRPEAAQELQALVEAAARVGIATTSTVLEPLDDVMVGEFLAHRLWRSGFTGPWPLSELSVHRIASLSGGVPGRILPLAAAEFETAWASEAVFAPRRLEPAAPVGAVPAVIPTPPAPPRSAMANPAVRTALAASALLAIAGTAGWLAWRTVEVARTTVAEADAAPPAAAPAKVVVAIAPPVAAVESAAPSAASARPAPAEAAPARPAPVVAGLPPPLPTVAAALVTAPAPDPEPAPTPPSKAVEPMPAEAAIQEAPASSPEPAAPAAAASEEAAVPAQVSEPVAAASAPIPSPPEPVVQLAQAPPATTVEPAATPVTPAAAPPLAAPAATAPSPSPPAVTPGLPVIAPSAGTLPGAAAPAPRMSAAEAAGLIRRGDEQVTNGDIAAARLWYQRAAAGGDPGAMRALARTYDARMLRQWGVVGMPADQARADEWYRKAAEAERAAAQR